MTRNDRRLCATRHGIPNVRRARYRSARAIVCSHAPASLAVLSSTFYRHWTERSIIDRDFERTSVRYPATVELLFPILFLLLLLYRGVRYFLINHYTTSAELLATDYRQRWIWHSHTSMQPTTGGHADETASKSFFSPSLSRSATHVDHTHSISHNREHDLKKRTMGDDQMLSSCRRSLQ